MWPYWKRQLQNNNNKTPAVYSPWKNLCVAQKQADASLLVAGALPCGALPCGARRLPNHRIVQKQKQPSEGSLSLHCVQVQKKKQTHFFILMRCPAPFFLTFLVQRLTSAVKLLPAFFLKKTRKKNKTKMTKKTKHLLWFLVLRRDKLCVHCKTHCLCSCTHLCSWRPRKGLLNVYYWRCAFFQT